MKKDCSRKRKRELVLSQNRAEGGGKAEKAEEGRVCRSNGARREPTGPTGCRDVWRYPSGRQG